MICAAESTIVAIPCALGSCTCRPDSARQGSTNGCRWGAFGRRPYEALPNKVVTLSTATIIGSSVHSSVQR
jgi:hypothetical protein